jgi:hypothetical protein
MKKKRSSGDAAPPREAVLAEKETLPTERVLKTILGRTYPAYTRILELTETFAREWKYYGKKYGWTLKIGSKAKALLYLTPQDGSFRVGFAVRDNERMALLAESLPADTKEELLTSKKVMEGFPLRINVTGRAELKTVQTVVGILTSMRTAGGRK